MKSSTLATTTATTTILDDILSHQPLETRLLSVVTQNRIPKDYFVTDGVGESNITIHAGSYHLALRDAGIEMCNIMTYSSILPGVAEEVERPGLLVHGSVMETIMAVSTSSKGERATAGITYGWLHRRSDGSKYGGLVCEYNGSLSEKDARDQLAASIRELYENGYEEEFELATSAVISRSFLPRKEYGTALVALCFINHLWHVESRSQ